ILSPLSFVRGSSETCCVWRSAAATPASFSAAITFRIAAELAARAAVAVSACVVTPKENWAWFGTAFTAPWPVTVIVRSLVASADPARSGRPAPAKTTAAASRPASANSFIRPLYGAARTPRHSGLRCGDRGRVRVEVGLPAGRDLRGGQADEEHGRGRPRRAAHRHRNLLGQAVSLAEVAGRAGGHDVLPDGLAATAARHDVVERQPARAVPAVDAPPAVPREEGAARDLPLRSTRHMNVRDQPDHVRPRVGVRRRMERVSELLQHLGLALEDEHVSPTHRAHVERLEARVQNEDVLHPAEMYRSPISALTWPVRPLPAPRARGRRTLGRARAPSRRSARSPGPGSR